MSIYDWNAGPEHDPDDYALECEDSAEWAQLDNLAPTIFPPGEIYHHGCGEANEMHAVVLNDGYSVIEGTPEQWRAFARAILAEFPHHGPSSVAGLASLRAGNGHADLMKPPTFNPEPSPLNRRLIDCDTGKDVGQATEWHIRMADAHPFGHVVALVALAADPVTCWIDDGEPF